ncbi:MAG: hypothetical protein Q8Q18_00885 [bacterium]|nr:hypothetical protein [bacterium]
MKRYVRFLLALVVITAPIAVFALQIVPADCSGNGANPCTFSQVFELVSNIIKFITLTIAVLASLTFMVAGFMYVFSAANEGLRSQAKSLMTNAVIGLVLAFGAYGIIKFIESSLGVRENYSVEALK